jgi:RNA-directed DNA polymerase
MTTGNPPMDEWKTLPWKRIERNVFKLQKRIYQASMQNDRKKVHKLQRLLMKSRSGRLLAVRRVTQDNQGKKTAGIDGVKLLSPRKRLKLSATLKIEGKASPVRRVEIPKPGTTELRKLGIPTMRDRALQSLVTSALEPEWEARFEPNSYGFRPGRSCHDAINAICIALSKQAKWCYDADIAKCFDRFAHEPLLDKVNTFPSLRGQIKAWLKSGVMDHGELFPTEMGSPQGGCISPLMANIALHGMENDLSAHCRPLTKIEPRMVRYADDFVILHKDKAIIEECQQFTTGWLKQMGLEPKASKTRVVHTLESADHEPGFDFLGFNIRQYRAGKTRSAMGCDGKLLGFNTHIKPSKASVQRHTEKLREIVRKHRSVEQELLIKLLAPKIVGWCNYFAIYACAQTFRQLSCVMFAMLLAWANRRHPEKGKHWIGDKYWRMNDGGGWRFQPRGSGRDLPKHTDTPVRIHTKVAGGRSPYDGDWVYWSTRLGREPTTPARVARLLKEQGGRCRECGLYFRSGDKMEIDHVRPRTQGGTGARWNLQLLHRHCHDHKTARDKRGTHEKRHAIEEPCDGKPTSTVLQPSRAGDRPA